MLNPLIATSEAARQASESASHRKHFNPATIAVACIMVFVGGVGSASAETTKRFIQVPHSSRHYTVPGGRTFDSVPQQTPCGADPRPGNPGIPCWDGGCGQCGFEG